MTLLKAYGYKVYLFENDRKVNKKRKTYKVKFKVYVGYLINYVILN